MPQNHETVPSRRTIARGAAWAVPVIAVAAAAPSASASTATCDPVTLDWNQVATGPFAGTTVGKTAVSASIVVESGTPSPNNGSVRAGQQGGQSGQLYFLDFQRPAADAAGETVTFTFTPPVQNLSFTVLDLDSAVPGWVDEVIVDTPGFTVSGRGGTVVGDGSAASPFAGTTKVAATSNAGNVTLSWPGPLTTVSFTYRNGNSTGSADMLIALSNLTFTPTSC